MNCILMRTSCDDQKYTTQELLKVTCDLRTGKETNDRDLLILQGSAVTKPYNIYFVVTWIIYLFIYHLFL